VQLVRGSSAHWAGCSHQVWLPILPQWTAVREDDNGKQIPPVTDTGREGESTTERDSAVTERQRFPALDGPCPALLRSTAKMKTEEQKRGTWKGHSFQKELHAVL
jgi:hypothetical protein